MDTENHVALLPIIDGLVNGYYISQRHRDTLANCVGKEYVRRHTHKPTDQLKLPTALGLMVLGIDKDDDETTLYHILPTGNYNENKDVIKPVLNPSTTHIVVVSNTTGKGPSALWKLTIAR